MTTEIEGAQEYIWIDYMLDSNLISKVEGLKERFDMGIPWEKDARDILRSRMSRVRTGPGHETSGADSSFSDVSAEQVPGDQVYAVLMKEEEAAIKRIGVFRDRYDNVNWNSSVEDIACAVHIAEVDGADARTDLERLLGGRLAAMSPSELREAKDSIGHEFAQKAYDKVKPGLL